MTFVPPTAQPGIDSDMMAAAGVPQLIFHGFVDGEGAGQHYASGNVSEPINVSPWMQSIEWTHSVNDPFEQMQVTLVAPQGIMQNLIPGPTVDGDVKWQSIDGYKARRPDTNFWAVAYLPNTDISGHDTWSAIAWGVCDNIQMRLEVENGVLMTTATLSFDSWVGQLKRSTLSIAPASNYVRKGFSYRFKDWSRTMTSMIRSQIGMPEGPGKVLRSLFEAMCLQFLPNSLVQFTGSAYQWRSTEKDSFQFIYGMDLNQYLEKQNKERQKGKPKLTEKSIIKTHRKLPSLVKKPFTISDMIPVVHNKETAALYTPLRLLHMKMVPGDGMFSLNQIFPHGTLWQFLSGMFSAQPPVELFPSLEWPLMWNNGKPAEMARTLSDLATDDPLQLDAMARGMDSFSKTVKKRGSEWSPYPAWFTLDWKTYAIKTNNVSRFSATPIKSGSVPAPYNGTPEKAVSPIKGEIYSDTKLRAFICQAMGGSMPCLIYRMKPMMFRPINQAITTQLLRQSLRGKLEPGALYTVTAHPTASEKTGRNQQAECITQQPNITNTFSDGQKSSLISQFQTNWWAYKHSNTETYSVQLNWDEDNRTTATFVKTPLNKRSQLALHGMMGDILVDNAAIGTHGFRLRTIEWPFFPAGMTPGEDIDGDGKPDPKLGTLKDKITAMNEEIWASIGQSRAVRATSTIETVYKPWLKAGMWTTGFFPEDMGNPVVDPQLTDRSMGTGNEFESLNPGRPGWVGYIQTVTHRVTALAGGQISATTLLSLDEVDVQGYQEFRQHINMGDREKRAAFAFEWRDGLFVTGRIATDTNGKITFIPGNPNPTGSK